MPARAPRNKPGVTRGQVIDRVDQPVSGDARAARVQLTTADQDARVAKDKRAKLEAEWGTAPMGDRVFVLHKIPSVMALMEWSASSGGDGLPAAYHVLEALVHPDDWEEFRAYARDLNNEIEPQDLAEFINAAMEVLAGRPTVESSGS